MLRSILLLGASLAVATTLAGCGGLKPGNAKAMQPLKSDTLHKLASMGASPGSGMMVRIFKESSELEVWKQTANGSYKHFKTYEICAWSGALGPKIKEGDRQSPEGFYTVTPGLMNPNSSYYLAFNTGFPNKFDRAYGRTGSDLMVHGDCSSRGCYSMTDESIAEIYALARESFKGGNPSFQLQIYPFRMSAQNLAKHADNPNMSFWKDIKEGYDRFEISKAPVNWDVCNKEYVFDVPAGTSLDALGACPVTVAQNIPDSVKAKAAADDAAVAQEVANLADKAARAAAEAQKQADAEAAAKQRGDAIGSFFGGLFGGGQEQGVIDPSKAAPKPLPRLPRA
ncbi:murein L,D-transpeptidase family protein [Devosia sp. ZB163]|uniref:murein L,D-transpeptidase family protein n=1 Tax=Devosia sp. ZB163 TaxID=3025938 RepID=UPI0030811854